MPLESSIAMLWERFSYGRVMQSSAHKPTHQPIISAMYAGVLVCLLVLFCSALLLHPYLSAWIKTQHLSSVWLFFIPCLLLIMVFVSLILDLVAISSCKGTAQFYVRSCFGLFVVTLSFSASLHDWHRTQTLHVANNPTVFSNAVQSMKASFTISHDFFTILAKGALDKDLQVRQAAFLNIRDKMGIEISPGVLGLNQTQSLIQGVVSKNTMEGFLP